MKKYTVETPHGTFTRKTERTYTAIVLHFINGCLCETNWVGSADLAQKSKLPGWRIRPGQSYTREIYAVDQ